MTHIQSVHPLLTAAPHPSRGSQMPAWGLEGAKAGLRSLASLGWSQPLSVEMGRRRPRETALCLLCS